MIVVDASIIAAFILKEDRWEKLAEYLVRCITPSLAIKEVANTIWKHTVLKQAITLSEAKQAYNILKSMIGVNIELYPQDNIIDEAIEIAFRRKITVYDALYIALAKKTNSTLVTLDEKQARAAATEKIKHIIPLDSTEYHQDKI